MINQTKQVTEILNKIQDYYKNQRNTKTQTKKFNISRQTISTKNIYLQQFEKKLEEISTFNARKSQMIGQTKPDTLNKDIATILKEKNKLPKTRICRQYIKTKQCRKGIQCPYAHKIQELDIEYAPLVWTYQFNSDTKRPQTAVKSLKSVLK